MDQKTCLWCLKEFRLVNYKPQKFCSRTCYIYWQSEAMKGEGNPNFGKSQVDKKGNGFAFKYEGITYSGYHRYLKDKHGSCKKCEFCGKEGIFLKTKNGNRWSIEFALKQGKNYSRNIEDYYQLCKKCHREYDADIVHKNPVYRMNQSIIQRIAQKNRIRNKSGQFTSLFAM